MLRLMSGASSIRASCETVSVSCCTRAVEETDVGAGGSVSAFANLIGISARISSHSSLVENGGQAKMSLENLSVGAGSVYLGDCKGAG